MNKKIKSLEVKLNLPERGSECIATSVIKEEYSRFIEQLQPSKDGKVILSDPYFFSGDILYITEPLEKWFASLTEAEQRMLLLLSLFSRPSDFSSQESHAIFASLPIMQVCFPDLNPEKKVAAFDPDALSLSERLKVLSDPGIKRLTETIPMKSTIKTLWSEFVGGQPGNYSMTDWEVSKWSDDWAVVYQFNNDVIKGFPFPWLLGFCRLKNLSRNYQQLLNKGSNKFDIGFYSSNEIIQTIGGWPD